jgi:hypothetical protein
MKDQLNHLLRLGRRRYLPEGEAVRRLIRTYRKSQRKRLMVGGDYKPSQEDF